MTDEKLLKEYEEFCKLSTKEMAPKLLDKLTYKVLTPSELPNKSFEKNKDHVFYRITKG